MTTRLLVLFVFLLSIFCGFLSTAGAVSFSGEYMFTVTDYNNDTPVNMDALEIRAKDWFFWEKGITREVDFEFYSKVDAPDASAPGMTVTYAPDNMTGTWATDLPIEFYTVKASTQFALYWLDGGAAMGLWSTEHIENPGGNQPEISHLSGWNPFDSPPIPVPVVPEPSTMVLLGLGVMGLVTAGRKKLRK